MSRFLVVVLGLILATLGVAGPRPFHVCLDPGHPSEVSAGTEVSNGLKEVEVVWDVCQIVKSELVKAGVKVTMTKSKLMQRVTNKERAAIANKAKADIMVRIHADAGGGSGFTIYYPAKQGNYKGTIGPSQEVIAASTQMAKPFHEGISEALKGELNDNGRHGDEKTKVGSQYGALIGSIHSEVPTVLLEMCFLTNKKDADWIRKPANKAKMAKAIVKGILAVRDRSE